MTRAVSDGLAQVQNVNYEILEKINQLNYDYRWYSIVLNPEENSVILNCDFYVNEDSNAHIYEMTRKGLAIAEVIYPEIMKTIWS